MANWFDNYDNNRINKLGMFGIEDLLNDIDCEYADLCGDLEEAYGYAEDYEIDAAQDRIEPNPSFEFQCEMLDAARQYRNLAKQTEQYLKALRAFRARVSEIYETLPEVIRMRELEEANRIEWWEAEECYA